MTQTDARLNPGGTVSQLDGRLTVPGLHAQVAIRRDASGVAHVRAENEHDAWFGQGFASAQDRLWQMEYDRRRAAGRWAEAAGAAALPGDVLARRLGLAQAAQADVAAMSAETRAMFEAYAAGVNAFLRSGQPLPVEYALTGLAPEPWQPWHSVAGFKVRHVLMGAWQKKLAQARLLAAVGAEAYARLDGRALTGAAVILPSAGGVEQLYAQADEELRAAAAHLGFLAEAEAGSNSWAVHGSHTTTGMPVLCNDSHRALDVPNVYWQVHVACPQLDVIGATFPGLPGFPHFGHNGSVAWSITHTAADYQDLYVEQFDRDTPGRYRTPAGWADAERHTDTIAVRGGALVAIELWRTHHGPVVHGDPRTGVALSLRYTATDGPCRGFEPLRLMPAARTVAELHESQRQWVDPVNNLVSADTSGNIGYLTRGALPVRSSQAHRQFPAPGWTGEHEWTGRVPFEGLPQAINPPEGFIATANQRVIPADEPYISHDFSPPSRAERIRALLAARDRHDPAQLAAMQGDTTSRPAQAWVRLLARTGPFDGAAERARGTLAEWDGNLSPGSGEALLYGCFRREVAAALFRPVVGERAWAWLTSGDTPALAGMIHRWLAQVIAGLDGGYAATAPDGRTWSALLPDVLAAAWRAAAALAGDDPAAWRWGAYHRTAATHTLSGAFAEHAAALNPPRVEAGGDGDTIQATSYGWTAGSAFDITSLPVYRQAVDLSDIAHAAFVVPGGVWGMPGSQHVADQLELWRTQQRVPMWYAESDITTNAVETLTLIGR